MTPGDDMQPTAARKLTYDDFLRFPDDGRRHELIEGDHYVTPSPTEPHQRAVLELTLALGNYMKSTRVGTLYPAPFDVILSRHDVVEPDLLLVMADQQDAITRRGVVAAPALVVEVLSPGTRQRDLTLKRQLYARHGVREYWMVDPDAQTVVVCRAAPAGTLDTVATLSAARSETLISSMLPGFAVAVGGLFASPDAARRRRREA
jgi:Uma2 family endonuclease